MRICVDATAACTPHRAGIAYYAASLVEGLLATAEAGERLELACRLSRWRRRAHRLAFPGVAQRWFQEPIWPLVAGCDVVHGTDVRVPRWRGCARVATLHDVFHVLPQARGWARPEFRARIVRIYARLVRSADRVICVSEATRRDFLAHLPAMDPERVCVVHSGVSARFRPHREDELAPVRARLGLPERYLLFVGSLAIRKNIPRLVRAYRRSAAWGRLPLVLAGGDADDREAIARERAEAGPAVVRAGYVPDADLPALYAGADALLYPTLHEGFGLPALEAMRSGVPVLGGTVGAVPEIVGGHGVLVDPYDEEAIAAGIGRVLATPADARERARLHAETFTWERCARETREVYRQARG